MVAVPQGRRVRYELNDPALAHALGDLLGVVLAVDPAACPVATEQGCCTTTALAAARDVDAEPEPGRDLAESPEQRLGRARALQEAAVGTFVERKPGDGPHASLFCLGSACMVDCVP